MSRTEARERVRALALAERVESAQLTGGNEGGRGARRRADWNKSLDGAPILLMFLVLQILFILICFCVVLNKIIQHIQFSAFSV